jgi:hypothetical protein
MSCDAVAIRQKVINVARLLAKKELVLEDVLTDIQRCQVSSQVTWSTIVLAVGNLASANFRGKLIHRGSEKFLEVPIMVEIGRFVVDLMSVSDDPDEVSFEMTPDTSKGYHVPVQTDLEFGESDVVIKKIDMRENVIVLFTDILNPNMEMLHEDIVICRVRKV